MVPGKYGIPYYGPPRFILLLAQPEHLDHTRLAQIPQRPPRIVIIRAEETPPWLWQRIALPPQFTPPTAVTPAPPTAIPTAPPFIVQAYQQSPLQWW